MNHLLKLAKEDLENARENLALARGAARGCDPTKKWGQSNETLAEIIAGYERWEKKALVAVAQAKALE